MKQKLLYLLPLFLLSGCGQVTYKNASLPAEERAGLLLKELTLEEKVSLMMDSSKPVERLGIKPYNWWNEALHGVARAGLATVFPQPIGMAASFSPETVYEVFTAVSDEARAKNAYYTSQESHERYQGLTMWTPTVNIYRDPRWGRGIETYGEDPYLTSRMGVMVVKGLQGTNDGKYDKLHACAKHFAVHSGPEWNRHEFNAENIKPRDLYETYLPPFEALVKEGKVKEVMCAYNRFEGDPCCGSDRLLMQILRDEWGFDGYVVSDWGGSNDHALGVMNGSHLEMPGTGKSGMRDIVRAVKDGTLPEEVLDQRLDELLNVVFATHQATVDGKGKKFDVEGHHALARKAAEESVVLLKNSNNILPLKPGTKVAVIGDFAKTPRYQGAGSSLVNPTKQPESILDVIGDSGLVMTAYEQGYIRNRKPNAALAKSAVEAAKNADVVLVFAGLDEISESEGLDRTHMHMPQAQNELIDEITAVNSNVVVVLSAGSSIEMPWFDYVKGIVHGYLGGQAGASAMMNVLTGKVCPSGKLNETYPLHYEDTPAFHYYPSKERSSEYREALYVGYRYYTTVGKKVRFPFGYGLSYTTFAYSNLSVDKDGVTFTIKNTGDVEGTEIAQLYVGKQSETIFRPVRELKGFARVTLAPGEEKSVHIAFDDKTFRFYDTRTNTWEVESGNYQIMVGTDADTMVLVGSLDVVGTVAEGGYSKEILPEYFSGKIENVDDIEYRELYGREIPDGSWSGEIRMNDAVCQLYYGKGIFGKLFYGVLRILLKISEWQGKPNLNVLFNYNMPIRGYAKMTGGFVTMEMARALTEMANGHRIKGTAHLIKAAVKRD